MNTLEPTAYNRLFYRLKVQALIQDLRRKLGEDEAWEIIQRAITLEMKHRADDDRDLITDNDHSTR